ncbi:MAG: HAD family hydrolase [Candidatus Marinimicrobia bacterium]|nr:HAD family hydrolase [Candidatus Neomarinimicrobiota bacterium]
MTPPYPAPLAAVLFDFDGTLIDASAAICHAFAAALEALGHPALPPAHIRDCIGRPLVAMFPELVPGFAEADIPRAIDLYRTAFRAVSRQWTRPLPGLAPLIETLAAADCRCAIVTSRRGTGTREILTDLTLDDRFPVIVGIEDVTAAKPHPEGILRALAALAVPPEQALMVGDTPDDIGAAIAAGLPGWGVSPDPARRAALTAAGANAVARDLFEIQNLLLASGRLTPQT